MQITKKPFGFSKHNLPVTEYTMVNASGASISVLDLGGIVSRIMVPDKGGVLGDVVLGYDDAEGYLKNNGYLGALIGRCGNRIGGASFELDGKPYTLRANNGKNNLHGGPEGFNERMFSVEELENGLRLSLVSPDGDQGFPGTVQLTADYLFGDDNALTIRYRAVTDKPTIVNLTNHSYFNLNGQGSGDVKNFVLQMFTDSVNEADDGLIPTGNFIPAKDVVYGFQAPTRIGEVLDHPDATMRKAGGVDFNFCASDAGREKKIATLYSPNTGRELQVYTDLPGVQVYTGQGLNQTGKGGVLYKPYFGICLETQAYPDAIHHENFPSVVLRPGDEYKTETSYRFSVR